MFGHTSKWRGRHHLTKKRGFLFFANIAEDTGENCLSKLGL